MKAESASATLLKRVLVEEAALSRFGGHQLREPLLQAREARAGA